MDNVIATENKTILDRAIKARQRRDRDGKKRRPVTDSLIEYVDQIQGERDKAVYALAEAESKIEVLRDVIAKQSATMEALEAQIAELQEQSVALAMTVDPVVCEGVDASGHHEDVSA